MNVTKKLGPEFAGLTVSNATLRLEDMIPAALAVIDQIDATQAYTHRDEYPDVVAAIDAGEDFFDEVAESAMYMWDDIDWSMNSIAPQGCYFGSHPGDGSDFGFWLLDDGDVDAIDLELPPDVEQHVDDLTEYDQIWVDSVGSRPNDYAAEAIADIVAMLARGPITAHTV